MPKARLSVVPADRSALLAHLEETFRELTQKLYDTDLPPQVVDEEVTPYLDPLVRFVDPWQTERGVEKYRLGLAGFHSMLKFHFEVKQVGVTLDEAGREGRCIVDGVMHLKLLAPLYIYPLRTILAYEFTVTDPVEGHFLIREHEEMWSFGDLIANTPVVGPLYARLFRPAFAQGWLVASWLSSRARGFVVR